MSGMGQFWTLPPGPNHYDQCEQYPLQCPNECGAENIKRKDMKTHRETCPLEPLNCPFQELACKNEELSHKNEEIAHKNEELVHKIEELNQKIEEFEERLYLY